MNNNAEILGIDKESFRANRYSREPFRMIGLIDVDIRYHYGMERVILPYYRSSGTNSGKIEGLWYPIVGIKLYTGSFREFSTYLNYVLTKSTKQGYAKKGWLAKSLFFSPSPETDGYRGFSSGIHGEKLYLIGCLLQQLFDQGNYYLMEELDAEYLNHCILSKNVLYENYHSQRENFELLIEDIFNPDHQSQRQPPWYSS